MSSNRGRANPSTRGRAERATLRSASTGAALPRLQASEDPPGPITTATVPSTSSRDLPPHLPRPSSGTNTHPTATSTPQRPPVVSSSRSALQTSTPTDSGSATPRASSAHAADEADLEGGAFSETAEEEEDDFRLGITEEGADVGDGTTVFRAETQQASTRQRSARLTSDSDSELPLSEGRIKHMMRVAQERSEIRLEGIVEEARQQQSGQFANLQKQIQDMQLQTEKVLSALAARTDTQDQRQAGKRPRSSRRRSPSPQTRTPSKKRSPSPQYRRSSHHPRFSGASQLIFGEEDTPLPRGGRQKHKSARDDPHGHGAGKHDFEDEEEDDPSDDSDSSSESQSSGGGHRSRRKLYKPKAEDLGKFNPSKDYVYNWWLGVMNYMEYTQCSSTEIFMGFPGCFEGAARNWFNRLIPRPKTLEEFRVKIFEAFAREELSVRNELEARRFDPDTEKLETYLDHMLNLVSELHVSRGVSRGTLRLQPNRMEALMTKETVADAIETVHSGLPEDWALFLEPVKARAQDWSDYRTKLIGREGRTKAAIQLLTRRAAGAVPRASTQPRATTVSAHAESPRSRAPTSTVTPPSRPRFTEEQQQTRKLDRQLGRCFHCHESGHSERDCPRLKSAIQTVKRVLRTLESGRSDEEVSVMVRWVEREMVPSVESPGEDESDDDAAQVRTIRAVLVSPSDNEADDASPSARVKEQPPAVPGRRHRGVVAHKVAVQVGKSGERVELHVDGGSPLSMISHRALRTVAPDAVLLPPEPLKIHGYRGDDYQRSSAVVVLPVYFPTSNGTPSVEHEFEFHVVDECTGGWLLGVDNMKADGIDALSKREVLVFEKRPDAVSAVRTIAIDPVTEDSVVEPWWFTHVEAPSGFIKVPACVIGPETRGVEVANVSDAVVELREGDVLGTFEPLERQLGTLKDLLDTVEASRKDKKAKRRTTLVRTLKSWLQKSDRGPAPLSTSPTRRVRRLTITHAEVDGGDVLPQIDVQRPDQNEQTVVCSDRLTPDQQRRLVHVLQSHAVWPTPNRPLGLYEYGTVSLKLQSGREGWSHVEPPRRTSPAQKEVIDETLREHDDLGISEPAQGRYASGVVLVQQRDKIRFCNDYRPLNRVTEDNYYAMPTVDVIFDKLGKSRFFTVVDANKGYYQFLLDEASRDLTGFITFRGLRRYRRMPFGLKQAPGWFQRAMDRILGAAQWEYAMAYLDDIVIFSPTFKDHLIHLDAVLAALERAGLTISPSKCRFAYESVALLGYKVSSLGLMTDEEKTRAVLDFPEPETAAEARRFFAMAAWYRRFIKDFAARAQPINKSFVGTEFVWGETEKAAFRDLKRAITSSPVLARPDFDRPFILAVDASKQGLGGVLMQRDDAGIERPLVYISRQTTDSEAKYAPTHLELAAVWWCVRKLHHYVDGSSVEVRTDHNALRWLWDLKPSELSEPRVQKFKMALAPLEHKVTVTYNRGKDNVVADALSRAPVADRTGTEGGVELKFVAREYVRLAETELGTEADKRVRSISLLRLGQEELDSWAEAYAADPHWRRIWRRARERSKAMGDDDPMDHLRVDGDEESPVPSVPAPDSAPATEAQDEVHNEVIVETPSPPKRKETAPARRTLRPRRILAVHRIADETLYFVKDGLLFVRMAEGVRICVPQAKLDVLVHEYHKSIRAAHPSSERTYQAMKGHVFAHDLAQFISEHIRTCYECQINKTPRHPQYGELEPIVTIDEVFHTCGLDFVTGLPLTPLGHDAIMVLADKYSRFGFFVPCKTTDSAEDVARRFLTHIFPVTGLPKAIISDRDSKFTSAFWKLLMHELDVKLAMSTAFHAQTDGLVERINAQVETMLRHYIALDQHDWDLKLPALAMAYNSQKQQSTGQSPYRLVFKRDPAVFPLRELAKSADPTASKVNDIFAIHADAQAAAELARERQRHNYNAHHRPLDFNVGDAVLINLKNYRFDLDPTEQARAKLGPRLAGPFRVKRRVGRLAYELDVPYWFKAHPVLPITALEPFRGDPDTVVPRQRAGVAADGGSMETQVKGFLGRRPTRFSEGERFDYLVEWWGPAPTWQCDTRLPGLAWARKTFEERARTELQLARLRGNMTIVLPTAKQRADELDAVEHNEEDAARTPGSSLGGEVVTDSQTETLTGPETLTDP
ncbi:hypothetical protein CF319_g7522 [Tilletia indica]|nr:hypothetical protein CF319_g7522 [Tilletia indica]